MVQPIVPDISFPRLLRRNQFIHIKKGLSPQYNYALEEFVRSPEGKIEENADCTFRQIVTNILLTPRGVYPIYDFNYGSDLHQLIGLHPDYVTSRIPNMVEEALRGNPRVDRVRTSDITVEDSHIFFTTTVTDALTGVRVRIDMDITP